MEKRLIKLGDIDLEAVVDEETSLTGESTDKPIEKGSDISDHFKSNPSTISLVGSVVGEEAPSKLAKLRKYHREGELLTYQGRNIFDNMIILSMPTKHNANNATGFDFDITLKQIDISEPETFEVTAADPVTKKESPKINTKVKAPSNKGRQQPRRMPTKTTTNPAPVRRTNTQTKTSAPFIGPSPRQKLKSINQTYTGGGSGGGTRGGTGGGTR